MILSILFSDISLNETESELEGCIRRIIALQGKGQFWKEVQGIQSGKIIMENNFCFILRTKVAEENMFFIFETTNVIKII